MIMLNDYSEYDYNYDRTTSTTTYKYLNGPILNNTIESITYTNTNTVPNNAIGSWDVSERQKEQ